MTGIAAQIMELSNNIMGGGNGGDYGRDVRPSFHGVRNFETDNSITSGSNQDSSIRNMARLISEYGKRSSLDPEIRSVTVFLTHYVAFLTVLQRCVLTVNYGFFENIERFS